MDDERPDAVNRMLTTETIKDFIYNAPHGSVSVVLFHSTVSSCKKCIAARDALDELENQLFEDRLRFGSFDVTLNTLDDAISFPNLPEIALTKVLDGET